MDDLQILLKAVIDENSQSSLDSKLASIAKSLSESHTVKLKVGFDEDSVKTVQSQLQTIAKQVGGANHTGTYKPLQVFDATQLKADGQRYFTSVKDIVSRAQAEFSKLGKTDITNVFKDSKGNIQSFTASVTKADGVVEKFNFNLAKIKDGAQSIKGFVQSNSILTDKNAGSNLEQTLNYLNRINTKIADITSKTLTNTSKPLLGDMEQFNQYQEKLNAVKARIEEIKQSNTTLSSEHKREIDSMVADLQRYAKELQTSAYAATDLKANTFANQKAELQASLETQIKKWQNAGIFGGDFKASVEEAKTALENALNPNDLDAYRHIELLSSADTKKETFAGVGAEMQLNTDRFDLYYLLAVQGEAVMNLLCSMDFEMWYTLGNANQTFYLTAVNNGVKSTKYLSADGFMSLIAAVNESLEAFIKAEFAELHLTPNVTAGLKRYRLLSDLDSSTLSSIDSVSLDELDYVELA